MYSKGLILLQKETPVAQIKGNKYVLPSSKPKNSKKNSRSKKKKGK